MTKHDVYKRITKGYHGKGICPCCRETKKRDAMRLARRRTKQTDNKIFAQYR